MSKLQKLREKSNEIVYLYESGSSTNKIGLLFNVNPGLIYVILKENGIQIKKKQKFVGSFSDYEDKIILLCEKGLTFKEIAIKLNINKYSIRRFLISKGLTSSFCNKKQNNVNLLKERKLYIVTEYINGKSIAKLMQELGLSRPRISKTLVESGVKLRKGNLGINFGEGLKRCNSCKETKELGCFYKCKSNADGYHYACKDCRNKHYIENRQRYLEYKAQYFNDNKEYLQEKNRQYRSTEAGKASKKAAWNRRRELKKQLDANYSKDDYLNTLKRFNNKCFKCGTIENLTLDHHYGLIHGCVLRPETAVILCRVCNSKKGTKHPVEFYSKEEISKLAELGINTTFID